MTAAEVKILTTAGAALVTAALYELGALGKRSAVAGAWFTTSIAAPSRVASHSGFKVVTTNNTATATVAA